MKRVLLTTYPGAFLYHGGGEREIQLLRDVLNSAGIITDIYGSTSLPLSAYNAVIHCSMIEGAEAIIDAAVEAGLPCILWPNLWFINEPSTEHIASLTKLLSKFDVVVFKSDAEERHFSGHFDLSGKKVIRVAPLVSPKFYRKDVTDVFRETHGLDRYAIWPGIIEPQKNQLAAIKAFRDLDLGLVITGDIRDRRYFETCRNAAKSNVRFLPAMQFGSELHLSALVNSKIFIELPLDFPGTSSLEAASLGCKLLLTQSNWCEEMHGKDCLQVDPTDEVAIRAKAIELLESDCKGNKGNSRIQEISASIEPLVGFLIH